MSKKRVAAAKTTARPRTSAEVEVPADHAEHLKKRPFSYGCVTDIFPLDELNVLTEQGNWLEALASGVIAPLNAEQEHFLKVDRDEAEPTTLAERAWVRLKGRREYEREQAAHAKPEPEEDYGIIEWDKEKCWW